MTTLDARDQGRPRARGRKSGRSASGAGGDVIGPGESLTGCANRLVWTLVFVGLVLIAVALL
jgi:hypothetical protein